jgi:hypothetical protein
MEHLSVSSFSPQQWRLIQAMLAGVVVDPLYAITECGCMIPAARCAELRKMGWPVRKVPVAHPNQAAFPGETLPGYLLDNHFRSWMVANPRAHPRDYPGQEGRGKFVEESKS